MAIPEKPESRAEMYLNRIASGSGTIPAQPESRMEQYLDAIARNGGGGGSGGGSGGGVLVVNDIDGTLDKTAGEIMNSYVSGIIPVFVIDYGGGEMEAGALSSAIIEGGRYSFTINLGGKISYQAATASDYPSINE